MKKRYAALDLVKFLGVFAIGCLLHYRSIASKAGAPFLLEQIPVLGTLARYGHFLVELLFLISGLLAYQSYFNRIAKNEYTFGKFLKGRIVRLYPAMILSTLAMAIFQWSFYTKNGAFFAEMQNNDLPHLFLNLLGLQTWFSREFTVNQPTWYLSTLMLCYLLFYGIAASCRKRDMRLLFSLPAFVGITILTSGLQFALLNSYIARGLCSFFLGVLLQMLLGIEHIQNRTFCLASLGILAFSAIFCRLLPFELVGDLRLFLPFFVYPAFVTLCIKSNLLDRLCSCAFIRYLGNISFGIYLWDIPIYAGLGLLFDWCGWPLDYTSPAIYALTVLLHLIAGIFSYHFVEKPIAKKFALHKTSK